MSLPLSSSSLLVLLCAGLLLFSTGAHTKSQLTLSANGTFKLAQFADIHYANGASSPCKNILPEQEPCSDLNSTIFIGRVLDQESPSLAVFTGDNIHDGASAEFATREFSRPAYSRGIPWAAIFGNHDADMDLNTEEIMDVIVTLPYAVSERGPQDVFGVGNYVLQVVDATGVNIANLYFLDSGAYSKFPDVPGYEWVRPSQINWFLETSKSIKESNGGKEVPALMFFHIPIPEYNQATAAVGDWQEDLSTATSQVNSGLFSAILEAGDVKATFVGHAHLNDFCGIRHGIHLCFGGGVGYHAYGQAGWERRSRLIEIRDNGQTIVTWKRLDDDAFTKINEQVLYDAKKI